MKVDFSARALRGLTIPQGKQRVTLTDSRTQGLQFELRKNGGFFNYRYSLHGRQRGIPIGRFGVLQVADARRRALELAHMVSLGQDPLAIKDGYRRCPTFDEFFTGKYLPFAKIDKRSWVTDDSLYRNHIAAVFGDIKMNQISKAQVREFLYGKLISGRAKGTVNRMLVLIRYCFNLAIDWEVPSVTENPVKGIKTFQENNKIERYVSQEESLALKHALEQSENPMLKYIIGVLLVTGARKQEALKAKWEDVDLAAQVWRIPLSKSGRVRHITLSPTAVEFFNLLQSHSAKLLGVAYDGCPYVFPNPKTLRPFSSIFYSWNTARKKAGLPDVRIHDLRHTFASTLVNLGVSLYEVQKLLGHAHIRTTERYAHLKQERLQASAALAGQTFGHILNTGAAAPYSCKSPQQPKLLGAEVFT